MKPFEKLLQHDLAHIGERLLLAVVVIAATFAGVRLITRLIERVRQRLPNESASIYVAEKLVSYGLIVMGAITALSVSGIDVTSLAVFAGATGVGIGLGLQNVVKEFVSGLVIMFDPNLNVGDFIEIEDGRRGEIMEIGPRASRLRTNDGLSIILPNSDLIENRVINWTFSGATRRIHLPFSVVYDADKAKVRDVVLKAAHSLRFTCPDTEARRTQVWMTGFGESAVHFELVVWPTPESIRHPSSLTAAYYWAIDDALRAASLQTPNSQKDLHLTSLFGLSGNEALKALGLKASPSRRRHLTTTSQNDAAEDVCTTLPPEPPRERPAP